MNKNEEGGFVCNFRWSWEMRGYKDFYMVLSILEGCLWNGTGCFTILGSSHSLSLSCSLSLSLASTLSLDIYEVSCLSLFLTANPCLDAASQEVDVSTIEISCPTRNFLTWQIDYFPWELFFKNPLSPPPKNRKWYSSVEFLN